MPAPLVTRSEQKMYAPMGKGAGVSIEPIVESGETSVKFITSAAYAVEPTAHSKRAMWDSASATPDHVHPGADAAGMQDKSSSVPPPSRSVPTTPGVLSTTKLEVTSAAAVSPAWLVAETVIV